MKIEARSAAVYRDFEKLYKLVALYQGNAQQLSPHVKNVDAVLQQALQDPEFDEGLVQFDFLMSAVFSEGKEVFRQPAPELTMAYALFCEGVRSIIAAKGLSGQEILDWCLLIRQTLDPTRKEDVDLASVLWRNRFPHLKIQIFNQLLNLEEVGSRESGTEIDAFKIEETSLDTALEKEQLEHSGPIRRFGVQSLIKGLPRKLAMQSVRDEWWSLPSAMRFAHNTIAMEGKEIERLRSQLADAAYSEKAKNLVRFSMDEVTALRAELEAYDTNHIEFNIMSQMLSVFESQQPQPASVQAQALSQLEKTLKSVVARFHAGLILFLIKRMAPLKSRPDLKNFIAEMVRMIREALQKEESRRLLLDSLESDEGRKTGFELLAYISKQEWPAILDTLIGQRRSRGIEGFLLFLRRNEAEFEKDLYSFGPERLLVVFPHLKKIEWAGKDRFILRCLQSRNAELSEAALEFLPSMQFPPDQVYGIYQRISSSARIRLLETFIENQPDKWAPFARVLLKSQAWRGHSEETSVSIIRFLLYSLHEEALKAMQEVVQARRWKFFPKFPEERDHILSVLTTIKLPRLKIPAQSLVQQEARVIFQSRELKERLRGAG